MSTPFAFQSPGQIVFGCGESRRLEERAAALGRKAVVLTGRHGARWSALLQGARSQGLDLAVFPVGREPTVDLLETLRGQVRGLGADMVLAIGGGSVIDAGKALAALLTNTGPLRDYLEVVGTGRRLEKPALPLIAVPTTAGTGAEATYNAVVLSATHGVKASLRHASLMPRLALVDPELTLALPAEVTASTGLDALTQLIEAFVSPRANPLTDGLCREGLRRAGRSLARAWSQGQDREARRDMSLASLCGGMALANAGLGAVHGFAGPLGGMLGAPHGLLCGRLLPEVMAVNLQALRARAPRAPALERYGEAAALVCGDPRASADEGVAWVRSLVRQFAISPLAALGLDADAIPEAVAHGRKASSMRGNPVELTTDELTAILQAAL